MRLLHVGQAEGTKAAVHAAVGGLAAVCAIYNSLAWLARRERHLAVSAIGYTSLAWIEWQHVRDHLAAARHE